MKFPYLLICFLLGLSTFTFAQGEDQYQSLFGGDIEVSGFGGPMMNWSQVAGQSSFEIGGGGGLILQNAFMIGGYGAGSGSGIKFAYTDLIGDPREDRFTYGYGGIWLGYMFMTKKLIHPTFDFGLAWGTAGLSNNNNFQAYGYYESTGIFVADPKIGLELNIVRWLRIQGQLGYRIVSGLDLASERNGEQLIKSEDMNGLVIGFNVKFGWF